MIFNYKYNLINSIYNYIKKYKPDLFKTYDFSYKTQKYSLKTILEGCILFIKVSSSWRNFKFQNINHNNLYKNFSKLSKENIFSDSYKFLLNKYLKQNNKKITSIYTDTTTVLNKYNTDCVQRNKYFKNKKVMKISIISDSFGIPLNMSFNKGNLHNSNIFLNQLSNYKFDGCNKKNFMADSGYDSLKIRSLLKGMFTISLLTLYIYKM